VCGEECSYSCFDIGRGLLGELHTDADAEGKVLLNCFDHMNGINKRANKFIKIKINKLNINFDIIIYY
jgi:hypothetical protein